jgi:hypothetical protein
VSKCGCGWVNVWMGGVGDAEYVDGCFFFVYILVYIIYIYVLHNR